ncbi:MAG TPA: alpha/beta hydrolase-fold protein [Kofleriaceae bacterium]|nr:alpha/beta hydrolase-fold protein [Kofleriaceae bacterium]
MSSLPRTARTGWSIVALGALAGALSMAAAGCATADLAAEPEGTLTVAAGTTTLRVHYDTGFGNRIAIRGSAAPLSWTVGNNATWTSGNVWVYSWSASAGDLDVKPLINDAQWSTGANYRVHAGATLDVYPFFGPAAGHIVAVNGVWSPQLGNSRTLMVYLPPSYNENPLKRYPVLYMHDGQNLFDAATSAFGVEWRVDENINALVGSGKMDEVIVVGAYNNANRIWEYTPCCDATYGGGGADSYERFLIDTVKPLIDQSFRTLPGAAATAIMGSSLGGLLSFYIARRNPAVFGHAGCMSSSFWWNDQALTLQVEQSTAHVPVAFYIDAGTSNDGLPETTRMDSALLADGYAQGADLDFVTAQGGSHNEASWAARVATPLQWMFPWQSTAF